MVTKRPSWVRIAFDLIKNDSKLRELKQKQQDTKCAIAARITELKQQAKEYPNRNAMA
jgi:predicted phosphoadenosine phosphosulfate sulfurtransferase